MNRVVKEIDNDVGPDVDEGCCHHLIEGIDDHVVEPAVELAGLGGPHIEGNKQRSEQRTQANRDESERRNKEQNRLDNTHLNQRVDVDDDSDDVRESRLFQACGNGLDALNQLVEDAQIDQR